MDDTQLGATVDAVDARMALARAIEPLLDQMAAEATDAIWREVPVYHDNPDANLRLQVVVHCRAVFETFLTILREDRLPTREEFPTTRSQALFRVGQGVSLTDFLRAFRVGQLTFWDSVRNAVGDDPALKDAALAAVSRLMQVIELGSSIAADAYLHAQQYRLADRERLNRDLIEDLLLGRAPGDPQLGILRAAGLTTEKGLIFVSATAVGWSGAEPAMQEIAAEVRRTGGRDASGLMALRHDELLGLFPVVDSGDRVIGHLNRAYAALRAAQVELAVGASTVHTQLSEVPKAYHEARVARDALAGCGGVLALSSVSTFDYLVLSNDETARRLIDPKIRRFVEEDLAAGGSYIETINAYVSSDMNAKLAAELLHLHVNTAYYRLERIAERTGLDLRKLPEVIDLLVAVRLLSPPPRRSPS
jgi:PucR-like helix-turn-helix protein/diguanylate cyclase with GGDEF domain